MSSVRAALPDEPTLPALDLVLVNNVKDATAIYVSLSIDLPTITVVPTGEVTFWYEDFDLDASTVNLQPVAQEILIQHLQSHEQELVSTGMESAREQRLEDYVVRALVDYPDVDYDTTADLLYKLANQLVEHLRGRLENDDDKVRNVLVYYQARLGQLVRAQLDAHRRERTTGYEVRVTSGHRPLKPATFAIRQGDNPRNVREPVTEKRDIPKMLFTGFKKCLYPFQKFESDPERRFAVVLENDTAVLKWVKPAKGNFQIQLRGGVLYEPDFVVETTDCRYLVEVKRGDLVTDKVVLEKAEAAIAWCRSATDFTKTTDGKPWHYVLIPDGEIQENLSMSWLANQFQR